MSAQKGIRLLLLAAALVSASNVTLMDSVEGLTARSHLREFAADEPVELQKRQVTSATCSGNCAASITSPNGFCTLKTQTDGNLVLYGYNGGVVWASNSVKGGSATYRLAMQGDGNLVLYNPSNQAIWSSGTCCSAGTFQLRVQDDCNLAIFNGNTRIWQTNTAMAVQIRNILQFRKCVDAGNPVVLSDCDQSDVGQRWFVDSKNNKIKSYTDFSKCLVYDTVSDRFRLDSCSLAGSALDYSPMNLRIEAVGAPSKYMITTDFDRTDLTLYESTEPRFATINTYPQNMRDYMSQRFLIPITTGDTDRFVIYGPNQANCLTNKGSGATARFETCTVGNTNQRFVWNGVTSQLKIFGTNLCLHANGVFPGSVFTPVFTTCMTNKADANYWRQIFVGLGNMLRNHEGAVVMPSTTNMNTDATMQYPGPFPNVPAIATYYSPVNTATMRRALGDSYTSTTTSSPIYSSVILIYPVTTKTLIGLK